MKNYLISYHKRIIFFFLGFCSLVYIIISVSSHNHFQTFGWDLGYFDQLIWKISQTIYPYSTLSMVNLFAGHFSPIIFVYAPLYWIFSDPRMLLIAQTIQMVFAGYFLYLLSFSKTKNILFSFSVLISYLFFLGTQWSILNEFHEMTIVPLFLVLFFYSLEQNKKWLFWLSIVGLLLTKEEISLLVASLGLTIWLYFQKKRLGLFLFVSSVIFFFFLTSFFIPVIF